MPLMLVTGHIRWRCVDLSSMPKSRSWNIKVHTQLERRNGWVVIAFANSAEVLGLKTQFKYSFLKFSLFTHAEVNGYPTLFRAGEGRDGEKEDWNSTSVILLPSWFSTSHFPMDTLHLFTQLIRIQGSNSFQIGVFNFLFISTIRVRGCTTIWYLTHASFVAVHLRFSWSRNHRRLSTWLLFN